MKTGRWSKCLLTELIAVMLVITHLGGTAALAEEEFEVIPDSDIVCIEKEQAETEEGVESGASITDEVEMTSCLIEDPEMEESEPDGLPAEDAIETEAEAETEAETEAEAAIETILEETASDEEALMEAAADDTSESAGILTLKQSEVTLYYASDNLKNQTEIPADKPMQYKIELSQTYDGAVTYSYWSEESNCRLVNDLHVDLTEDGVIIAKGAGESMIRVQAGSSVMFLTVHVKSYDREYVENLHLTEP